MESKYLHNYIIGTLIFTILFYSKSDGIPPRTQDYCQSNYFNVTCHKNQVIVITSARYGRMSPGKCVTSNHGFMGCSKNVIGYMHRKCSGRLKCKVYIAEPELHATNPCPKDFASYMEAGYECINVANFSPGDCHSTPSVILSDETGYISTDSLISGRAGTALCPWEIRAEQGQRIRLFLFNFAISTKEENGDIARDNTRKFQCFQVGSIKDETHETSITTCGNTKRETNIYESRSERIKIIIKQRNIVDNMGPFLIKYEVYGCKPPKLQSTVSYVMTGEEMIVKCNFTEESWTLSCRNNKWIGEIGNCREPTTSNEWTIKSMLGGDEDGFPYGILVLVAIGVALGVFLGGLLLSLAIFYIKRNHLSSKRQAVHSDEFDDMPQEHIKDQNTMNEFLTWPRGPREQYFTELCSEDMMVTGTMGRDGIISKPNNILIHSKVPYHQRPCDITIDSKSKCLGQVFFESPQHS